MTTQQRPATLFPDSDPGPGDPVEVFRDLVAARSKGNVKLAMSLIRELRSVHGFSIVITQPKEGPK